MDGEFYRFLFVVYKDGMCPMRNRINHDFFNHDFMIGKVILKKSPVFTPLKFNIALKTDGWEMLEGFFPFWGMVTGAEGSMLNVGSAFSQVLLKGVGSFPNKQAGN